MVVGMLVVVGCMVAAGDMVVADVGAVADGIVGAGCDDDGVAVEDWTGAGLSDESEAEVGEQGGLVGLRGGWVVTDVDAILLV